MAYNYERRNEIARQQGFSGYAEKRRAISSARTSDDFARTVGPVGGARQTNVDMALLYYQAFRKGDPDDYSVQTRNGRPVIRKGKDGTVRGAKAKWLIDVAQFVGDADEWRRRYPNGQRDAAWLAQSMRS